MTFIIKNHVDVIHSVRYESDFRHHPPCIFSSSSRRIRAVSSIFSYTSCLFLGDSRLPDESSLCSLSEPGNPSSWILPIQSLRVSRKQHVPDSSEQTKCNGQEMRYIQESQYYYVMCFLVQNTSKTSEGMESDHLAWGFLFFFLFFSSFFFFFFLFLLHFLFLFFFFFFFILNFLDRKKNGNYFRISCNIFLMEKHFSMYPFEFSFLKFISFFFLLFFSFFFFIFFWEFWKFFFFFFHFFNLRYFSFSFFLFILCLRFSSFFLLFFTRVSFHLLF